MRITRLALVAAFAALACSDSLAPTQVAGDVATMHARWLARRPANYSFDLRFWNEWVAEQGVRITVRNHQFHSAQSLATGYPLLGGHEGFTLDSLFAMAFQLLPDTSLMLELRFDARSGLISRLRADWPLMADESYGYSVTRFDPQ